MSARLFFWVFRRLGCSTDWRDSARYRSGGAWLSSGLIGSLAKLLRLIQYFKWLRDMLNENYVNYAVEHLNSLLSPSSDLVGAWSTKSHSLPATPGKHAARGTSASYCRRLRNRRDSPLYNSIALITLSKSC